MPTETRHVCLGSNDEEGQLEWIMNEGDIDAAIDAMIARIINAVDEFQNYGSGFKWEASISLEIKVMKKKKGTAQSRKAGHYLQTPQWIKHKKAVINMKPPQDEDDKCFAWVLLRARYPIKHGGGIQRQSIGDLRAKLNEVILPSTVTYPIPMKTDVIILFLFLLLAFFLTTELFFSFHLDPSCYRRIEPLVFFFHLLSWKKRGSYPSSVFEFVAPFKAFACADGCPTSSSRQDKSTFGVDSPHESVIGCQYSACRRSL
jgi:hypothetical protein